MRAQSSGNWGSSRPRAAAAAVAAAAPPARSRRLPGAVCASGARLPLPTLGFCRPAPNPPASTTHRLDAHSPHLEATLAPSSAASLSLGPPPSAITQPLRTLLSSSKGGYYGSLNGSRL